MLDDKLHAQQGEPLDNIRSSNAVAGEEVIRLALVMNGGVSLAVWMAGATHEIDRLLARTGLVSPAWAAILAQPRKDVDEVLSEQPRRVVVDYVAGASAGGLNGGMLATAIAYGAPLVGLKKLWADTAKLDGDNLLSAKDDPGDSLLNGPYFEHKLGERLDVIAGAATAGPGEVTLLVTTTSLYATPEEVRDSSGHELRIANSRRVHRFVRGRGSGTDDFTNPAAVAHASRASAGFPVAFPPLEALPETADKEPAPAVEGLKGQAEPPAKATPAPWLIDGGVLDNAPFEPLLEELTANPRPDGGPRWIGYLVPTTGRGKKEAGPGTERPPGWVKVLKRVLPLFMEADLRDDVEALRRLQAEAGSYHERAESLIAQGDLPEAAAGHLLHRYQLSRARGFLQFARESRGGPRRIGQLVIPANDVTELVGQKPYFLPRDMKPTHAGRWQWGTTVARRLSIWMSRDARARMSETTIARLAMVELRVREIDREIGQLIREDDDFGHLQAAVALTKCGGKIDALVDRVFAHLDGGVTIWAESNNLTRGASLTKDEAWSRLLSVEVLLNFAVAHRDVGPPAFDVICIDTGAPESGPVIFPEVAGPAGDEDAALRAELLKHPDMKLYGARLGHFGAFGRVAYREHDWLWGRLDGAVCLSNALLGGVDEAAKIRLQTALVGEILTDEGVTGPQLAALTMKMIHKSGWDLARDMVGSGELDPVALADSVARALSKASAGHFWLHGAAEVVGSAASGGVRLARGIRRFSYRLKARSSRPVPGGRR